jgi:hypothetical protein
MDISKARRGQNQHSPVRSRSHALEAFLRFGADFLGLFEAGLGEINGLVGQVAPDGFPMLQRRSSFARRILFDFLANDSTLLEALLEAPDLAVDDVTESRESSFGISLGLVRLVLDVRVRSVTFSRQSILAIRSELSSVTNVRNVLLSLVCPQGEKTKETSLVALFVTGRVLVDDFGLDVGQGVFRRVDSGLGLIAD